MGKRFFRLFIPTVIISVVLSAPAAAQLLIGQYENEAALRSWNIVGPQSATSLGLGGARFAVEQAGSASLTNPALLAGLTRYSLTLNAALSSATLYKFSLVNTGAVTTRGNVRASFLGVDSGSVALRRGRWALAFTSCILENYGRPSILYSSPSYTLEWKQTGVLRGFNAALARSLSDGLSVGIGITYAVGRLSRSTREIWPPSEVTITDDKSEKFTGFYVNGGMWAELSSKLAAAVMVRTPYVKKAGGESHLRYLAPREGTDIAIDAEASNEYRQPWVVGVGTRLRFSENLTAAADLTYFGWSKYSVFFFEETLIRDFRDVFQFGGGFEYLVPVRLRDSRRAMPIRLGLTIDPQPMESPRSSYTYLSFGTGLRFTRLAVDAALRFGRERGSGNNLSAFEAALTLRYFLTADE